jgi:hypothetical protein
MLRAKPNIIAPPRLLTSCIALPPEGAARLWPGEAGSTAPLAWIGGTRSLERASSQAGAAGLALPDRRRSGPLGGQGDTRSERSWGLIFAVPSEGQ